MSGYQRLNTTVAGNRRKAMKRDHPEACFTIATLNVVRLFVFAEEINLHNGRKHSHEKWLPLSSLKYAMGATSPSYGVTAWGMQIYSTAAPVWTLASFSVSL